MAKKTIEFWSGKIKEHTIDNDDKGIRFGPDSALTFLQSILGNLEGGLRDRYGDPPSKATIGRIQLETRKIPDEEKTRFRWFYWPESMEKGHLPWEASRPLLELLARTLARDIRPSLEVCWWYWRLYQAVPDSPGDDIERLARILADSEGKTARYDIHLREVEGWLAYQGWILKEVDGKDSPYIAAATKGTIPDLYLVPTLHPTYSEEVDLMEYSADMGAEYVDAEKEEYIETGDEAERAAEQHEAWAERLTDSWLYDKLSGGDGELRL